LQIQKERKQQEENERKRKEETIEKESEASSQSPSKKSKKSGGSNTVREATRTDETPIEKFEEGASEWVTKKEAMNIYCLPEGTLAVCEVEERENPHNKLWKPMKLYRRSEIRERAHKRFGGLDGLVAERNMRRERKFAKDMEAAADIFK
jgi:DNA-repair protein complementing XP-A cells